MVHDRCTTLGNTDSRRAAASSSMTGSTWLTVYQGEADLAVAEELHDHAGRDAGGEKIGGGAVAEIIRAVRRGQASLDQELLEVVVDVGAVQGRADGAGEHEIQVLRGGRWPTSAR